MYWSYLGQMGTTKRDLFACYDRLAQAGLKPPAGIEARQWGRSLVTLATCPPAHRLSLTQVHCCKLKSSLLFLLGFSFPLIMESKRMLKFNLIGLIFVVVALSSASAFAQSVCVDPGHGGSDPGAVGCGLEEAFINLDVSLRLQSLLQGAGVTVYMTRETDVDVSLSGRTQYANSNGADRFASIHTNSAGSAAATGTETFAYTSASATSLDQRDRIQAAMIAAWGLADRGGKTANFQVLRETNMPATLSELAFIVNCGTDAVLLGSPDSRQEAAQAHFDALMASMGLPTETRGDARGVVFEDQGVGTDDMSITIPGAQLTIVETGDTTSAAAGTAAWSFSLAPGTYTLRATATGYQTNERSCTVTAGGIAWCSIGLFPATVVEEPPVESLDTAELADTMEVVDVMDSMETEDMGTDISDTRDVMDANDTSATPDQGQLEGSQDTTGDSGAELEDANADLTKIDIDDGCGCSLRRTSPISSLALWLVLGVGLLWGLRPRRAALWLLALPLGAALVPSQAQAEELIEGAPQVLQEVQLVAQGHSNPVISRDGEELLSMDPSTGALLIQLSEGSEARVVADTPRAGYAPEWLDKGQIAVRLPQAPYGEEARMLFDSTGTFLGPELRTQWVYQDHDQVYLQTKGQAAEALCEVNERCFAPLLSPDGNWLVLQELSRGMQLIRLEDGARFELADGHSASFAGNSERLVLVISADDGAQITKSELFLIELGTAPTLIQLTDSSERHEQQPSLDAEGKKIAFGSTEGSIFVAEIPSVR